MASTPLRTLKCPLCRCLIETNLGDGQFLKCPSCERQFAIDPSQIQDRTGNLKEGFYRLLIPVGYALFLVAPLAGIIYYVSTRVVQKNEDTTQERAEEKNEKPFVPNSTPRFPTPAGRPAKEKEEKPFVPVPPNSSGDGKLPSKSTAASKPKIRVHPVSDPVDVIPPQAEPHSLPLPIDLGAELEVVL
ncbi:MAG TPA: hypothetical protein VLM40_00905, partial [Gemmata sp.]|nr:hypothetical protein [Gemmata sp.]